MSNQVMSRILIVEDEPNIASLLAQALTESGYDCATASNGAEGLHLAKDFDIVVADVMMPILNGIDMVHAMRARGVTAPVLFLTARDSTPDIVRGFDVGGDDYLVKPFKLEELLARISALLRRSNQAASRVRWLDLELDRAKSTASRAGHALFFSRTEYALLEILISQPGHIFSKSSLLVSVWDDDGYRADNIVELYINYLRKKTERFDMSRVIHTVRGKGYVLAETPE